MYYEVIKGLTILGTVSRKDPKYSWVSFSIGNKITVLRYNIVTEAYFCHAKNRYFYIRDSTIKEYLKEQPSIFPKIWIRLKHTQVY